MEQLIEFITNHWMLSLAAVTVTVLLIAGELQQRLGGIKDVSPARATQLVNHENAVVLDVREKGQHAEGSLPNAISVPLDDMNTSIAKLEKFRKRPLIAFCGNGQKSRQACALLNKQGFDVVYNLDGGLTAWQNANMPVQKLG